MTPTQFVAMQGHHFAGIGMRVATANSGLPLAATIFFGTYLYLLVGVPMGIISSVVVDGFSGLSVVEENDVAIVAGLFWPISIVALGLIGVTFGVMRLGRAFGTVFLLFFPDEPVDEVEIPKAIARKPPKRAS